MLRRKRARFNRAARRGIYEGRAVMAIGDWTLAHTYLQLMKSIHEPEGAYIRALRYTMFKEAIKVRISKCP
ncbi:hypothetical protein SEA_LISARA_44 [Arthrobacter phage LiSara]|uniref:Uncharacterized protein n=2 Tax=Laroyevirus TaxID=1982086 RepID=A0A222ZHE2_9CAUD|nr:hypothetical protein KMD21_gp44 [Arthrobacter phage LiSara]YP_010082752.1 hypothetical protein KMD23_gp44 [Arthrobacter phage Wheelbite]ASR83628.1 hypothetical protein SEA_LISARA_44 [Arthrobacter phage LiSara]ASR84136.1 hypothetical protein SEA_WHEELBITE_44 [Arthrobacter phage Wheelbite]QGJ88118.1 hypothetical protein PBI_EDMUNDO_45 [Arthrobacter phage Edmundo]